MCYTFADRIASTEMGDHTAFFYGTLMAKEVLYRVIFGTPTLPPHTPQTLTSTPALLPNHLRSRVRYADYPGVIPSINHSVRGTYVTGLTSGDLYRLDLFEGPQYSLETVRVKLLKTDGKGNVEEEGEEVETKTYIWIAGEDELESKEWDYQTFRREKMRNWVGSSVEFEDVDNAVKEMQEGAGGVDPTGGRGIGGAIAQNLDESHAKEKQEQIKEKEPFKSAV